MRALTVVATAMASSHALSDECRLWLLAMKNLPTDLAGVESVFASMPNMKRSIAPCMNYAESVENEAATYSYADIRVPFLEVLLPLTKLTLTSMTTLAATSQSCGNFDSNGGVMLRTLIFAISHYDPF